MKRNRVPFQKGLSLLALLRQYRTAVQCAGRRRGSLSAGLLLPRLRQPLPLPPADPSAVAVPSLSTAGVRNVTANTISAAGKLLLTIGSSPSTCSRKPNTAFRPWNRWPVGR